MWLLSGTLFAVDGVGERCSSLANLAKHARVRQPAEPRALGVGGATCSNWKGRGRVALPVEIDDSVPPGAVFVPYAYAEAGVNRLGAPKGGAGLRRPARPPRLQSAGARRGAGMAALMQNETSRSLWALVKVGIIQASCSVVSYLSLRGAEDLPDISRRAPVPTVSVVGTAAADRRRGAKLLFKEGVHPGRRQQGGLPHRADSRGVPRRS